MRATTALQERGQSLWLDNITRSLLDSGRLQAYISQYAVTGLTSNPTIFEAAIKGSSDYDEAILAARAGAASDEALFFELALHDLRRAADLFAPVFAASGGSDGFVSLEVSPELAHDPQATIVQARALHAAAAKPNLLIKIPGTREGERAIEEAIFEGIPVNVTLLFSPAHYWRAAEAYLRGLERRLAAGLSPRVASVASVFVSRWDRAANHRLPPQLRNKLGIAVMRCCYAAYREVLAGERFRRLQAAGALPQRLLWASTGSKDPGAPDTLYVEALVAPLTVNTVPEATLLAFAEHGRADGTLVAGDESGLDLFEEEGVDVSALAESLQEEGAQAFVASWRSLLEQIRARGERVALPA